MKVILQQNVQKLGKVGDIVEASPGYFRNFLQPRKLAVVATDGTLKKREEDIENIRKKAAIAHQEALDLSERVKAIESVRLFVKAGNGGRLYGKVTNKDIAGELSKALGQEVDKRSVRTHEDITTLGTHKAFIKLASEVTAELIIEIYEEGTDPEAAKAAAALKQESLEKSQAAAS